MNVSSPMTGARKAQDGHAQESATVAAPIKVKHAPVLTLWTAVVAERLGHPPDLAL